MNYEEEGNRIIELELKAKDRATERKHELDMKRAGSFDILDLTLSVLVAAAVSGGAFSFSVYHSMKSDEEVCKAYLTVCMSKDK